MAGGPQFAPCPGYSQAHPRGHRPIRGLSPHAQRSAGAQRQVGAQIKDSEEQTPCVSPSPSCPSRASAPVSRRETHHEGSLGAALQITFWTKGGFCLRVGHIMGCRGKAVQDCTGLIMGYLGDDTLPPDTLPLDRYRQLGRTANTAHPSPLERHGQRRQGAAHMIYVRYDSLKSH